MVVRESDRRSARPMNVSKPSEATPPAVVLVHGAWHGPWVWDGWRARLTERGYDSVAVTLPGHATPGRRARIWNRVRDYVDATEAAVDAAGGPVVLVGHSMGGYVVQRLLERRHPSVLGAVLVASVPLCGTRGMVGRCLRDEPLTTLRALALADPYVLVGSVERTRRAFFTPATASSTVAGTFERLQNESALAALTMLVRTPRPRRSAGVPVMVLAAEHDAVFTSAEQEAMARAHGVDATVIAGAGHDLMVDQQADEGIDAIIGWIRDLVADNGGAETTTL
jgi:hypothetical protein